MQDFPELTPEFMTELKKRLIARCKELPLSKQFSMRLAKPKTWVLSWYNPSLETPHPHVLEGENFTLVVDPTETTYDLRGYIQKYISDKPIKVINTHSHGDHTLSNGQFNDCEIFMSRLCWEEIKRSREAGWNSPRQEGHIMGDYVPTIIEPGDVIDLGGRELEVLDYHPCHSPTSLVYLDRTYGILFPGDEIDPGQINIWGMPVETFRNNMMYLKERMDEFDMICPAHNGTPIHAETINNFIENCDRIMSGIEGDLDVGSMSYLLNPFETRPPETVEQRRFDPETRRSEWKGTALNYNVNLIFNSQKKD